MTRIALWIIAALAFLALAAGLFLLLRAPEAAELAAEGGQMPLRDTMRPIRGETRLVVIAPDGVGNDMLHSILEDGLAPRLARLLGERVDERTWTNAAAARDVITIAPSMTMAAWTTVATGAPPGHTGVPGNEWFDRVDRTFYAPGMMSTLDPDHLLAVYADDLLGERVPVPSAWEGLPYRTHISFLPMYRGADLMSLPAADDIAEMFAASAGGVTGEGQDDREPYATLDTASVDRILEGIDEFGLPDVQFAYFPGIDLYTHVADDPLPDLRAYFSQVIDPQIGRLVDRYEAEGVLEDTFFVILSDHGHTPVPSEDRHALGSSEHNDPHEVARAAGFRPRPQSLHTDANDYQAAFAYQGPVAFVYTADRSSCPDAGDVCDWARPPRFEEDILPLARAFADADATGRAAPEMRGALDLIFVREAAVPGESAPPFRILTQDGPVDIGTYLQETPRDDLPMLERRMEWLATGPLGYRAGEILLMARYGEDVPFEERFYFSMPYSSSHGGLNPQDSFVPIVVAHHARTGDDLRATLDDALPDEPSILDVAGLLRALLEP